MQRNKLFDHQDTSNKNISYKKLEAILSEEIISITAVPYLEFIQLDKTFSKENKYAEKLIKDYIDHCDVNVSNNLGITLLHLLVMANRADLAKKMVECDKFIKINYKLSLPTNDRSMYASALDLSAKMWPCADASFDLVFIETMLQHGALPPDPNKKFVNFEFTSFIYPQIIFSESDNHNQKVHKSTDEIRSLLCLLHQYGFSIDEMEKNMRLRLFDTGDSSNNRAEEFAGNFDISIDKQKSIFDNFMVDLKNSIKYLSKKEPIVTMNEARLNNGENTLRLPFDPNYRPCIVM